MSECPHRRRSCHRHMESRLRQQQSYAQSTPDVASKFRAAQHRGVGGTSGTAGSSQMQSAVSIGELLDVNILPIFQKLLTERHKGTSSRYGASIASCPNLSIKCDIVEYL